MGKSYNKTESDFPTLLEYNDYLEEVEDISELHKLLQIYLPPIPFYPYLTYVPLCPKSTTISDNYYATVFSIVNEEPNAEEAKAKVKAYEEANRPQIVIRQSQRADRERDIADR